MDENYPEFDALEQFESNVDKAAYLLKLAKRYSAIAKQAKEMANGYLSEFKDGEIVTSYDGTEMKIVCKNLSKVDTEILKSSYPEIYNNLCAMGEITVSTKSVKDYDVKDAIINSKSRYAELCH